MYIDASLYDCTVSPLKLMFSRELLRIEIKAGLCWEECRVSMYSFSIERDILSTSAVSQTASYMRDRAHLGVFCWCSAGYGMHQPTERRGELYT